MRQKSETRAGTLDQIVKDIRRATRKHNSAEENTRAVLEGLRSEYSIAALCRREHIAWSL
jgi:transposase